MNVTDLKKYLKKSFITGSVKTIIVSLVTLILLPLIIREIGMARYGLVALTMIFGGAAVLVDFGIAKSITLLLGKTDVLLEKEKVIADSFLISISILFLFGLVLLSLMLCNVSILGGQIELSKNLEYYIVFSGFLTLSVIMINNLLMAILEASLLMHYVNIGFGLSSIAFHVVLYLVGVLLDNDYMLVSSPFISYLVVTVYYLFLIKTKTPYRIAKPSIKRSKAILPVSMRFLSISLVSSFVLPVNKYMLVLISGNPVLIGVFDLSLKIAQMANSFLNSIAQPLFGVFSKFKNSANVVFKVAKRVVLLIFCMYLIGVVLFFFSGTYIANMLDPLNKEVLYETCFILIIMISFTSVSEPFYRAFIGLGQLNKAMKIKSMIVILNLIFYFAFYKLNPLMRIVLSYGISLMLTSGGIIISGMLLSNKSDLD